jgi:hypothetical protein
MLRKSIISAAVAFSFAMPFGATFAGGVATGGSTEFTQIASWIKNFEQFREQIVAIKAQLAVVTDTLKIADDMKAQISSVTGIVRDAQGMVNTVREMADIKGQISDAFGSLDNLRDASELRFTEISRYKNQFGDRKSVQDYFIEDTRENARAHKMNQVLRDNEAAAIKRLEDSGKAIQSAAGKIQGVKGVTEAVSLMSSQINTLAAMTADINKIGLVRAAKQTDQDDKDLAQQSRDAAAAKDRAFKMDAYFARGLQNLTR